MNSNSTPPYEAAAYSEAVKRDEEADDMREAKLPVRRFRRAQIAQLMHSEGKPGDAEYRRGIRSQKKLEAKRAFELRRQAEKEHTENKRAQKKAAKSGKLSTATV